METSLGPRRRWLSTMCDASYAFLGQKLRKGKDKAFVIRFGHEVELLQDFTSSLPKLHAALQLIQTTDFSGGGRAGRSPLYDAVCFASNESMKTPAGAQSALRFVGRDRSR